MAPQRGQAALTGLLTRHPAVQRLLADLHGCRLRPQNAAYRSRVVVDFETAEVPAFAAVARANHVAGNLIEVPRLVGETDRTSARRAIAVSSIGHPDGEGGRDASPESEGLLRRRRFRRHRQPLDSKAVLVCE